MSIAKHWCYTLNNYSDDDLSQLSNLQPRTSYHVFGIETGASGTQHLQGTICFSSKIRMSGIKRLIPSLERAHLEVCRNLHASIEYCKKDGDYREFGEAPSGSGRRSDLEDFKDAVKGGIYDIRTIRERYSNVYAKYPRFVIEYIRDQKPVTEVTRHPLRAWQADLFRNLRRAPDEREVIFIVDKIGNSGKSWFVDYYDELHSDSLVILPGKKADMVYCFATCGFDPRVVFVDCPRSKQGEFIQYDFLEDLKNGRVFCSKYESHLVRFRTPHVVVMMNEEPDRTKLSSDRYLVVDVNREY